MIATVIATMVAFFTTTFAIGGVKAVAIGQFLWGKLICLPVIHS